MNLTNDERAVYELIIANGKITQYEISKAEKWLGCYSPHEDQLRIDKSASTLRKIRGIVRTLRMKYGLPILSDKFGYFIMRDKSEAEEYIKRIEKTAKSQVLAWQETYACMSKMFSIKSEYFEETNKVVVKQHTRRKKKDDGVVGITVVKLFDL